MNLQKITVAVLFSLLLLPSSSASAGDVDVHIKNLRKAAAVLEALPEDRYAEAAPKEVRTGPVETRNELLGAVYRSLAALEYRQSLEAGLKHSKADKASESRDRLEDAGNLAVDPDSLEEAGWWGRVSTYINRPTYYRYRGTAVAAVRGGRTIKSKADRNIRRINKSLTSVSRSFSAGISAQRKASLHYKTGRIYEKLAKAVGADAAVSKKAAENDIAVQIAQLKEVAGILEKLSDESYLENTARIWRPTRGGSSPRRIPQGRWGTLGPVYTTIAALEYRQSLESGLSGKRKERAEASRDTILEDAENLAIDPDTLENSSWWRQMYSRRFTVRTPHAVAAVRGGRAIRTKGDREVTRINKSLQSVSRSYSGDLSRKRKARFHYKTGRLYEDLAATAKAQRGKAPRAAAPARELSARQIYKHYGRAVVLLMCVGSDGNGELGTGSVIDDQGRILTNAHVVIRKSTRRPYAKIKVYFKPKRLTGDPQRDLVRSYEGRVTSWDRNLDLAIVELVERPSGKLTVIPIGMASEVEAGEPVVAIGHPEQGGLWTLTTGVVSTVIANLGGVKGKDVFQTDASINRGNSGGPLIDMKGALIGVNTSMARRAKDGLTITAVNFAVKSDVVKDWIVKNNVKADFYHYDPRPYQAESRPPSDSRWKDARAGAPAKKKPKRARKKKTTKAKIITPKKPFSIKSLIQREIAQMEDLEGEMQREINKRRGWLQQQKLKNKK